MAVTAEDKKYLSASGIAAVQKATDAWNKANATGDKAGMQAAAASAAAVRANSNSQISGGSGYTTDSWGHYQAPISTTPTQSTQSTLQSTTSDPYSGRDIAHEIVSLLTGGGIIDYDKLNSLAQQRDAKQATNPKLYGQFESTQDLINKYLPLAQQNEALTKQVQALQNKPTSDIDNVINLLTQLGQSSTSSMSFDEAKSRAGAELNPMYEDAMTKLMSSLNSDMEKRGIYNAPLASGIMTSKAGELSNDQISNIASRANELIQNDAEMSLEEKRLKSSTLSSLLSSLVGRESNLADITGYYNGNSTLARDQYNTDTALQEGALTGNYNGQSTLEAQQLEFQKQTQSIASALSEVQTMGRVTTQEQADILGVPVGSSTLEASEAAAQRQQEMQQFNAEQSYRYSSLALQKQAQDKQDLLNSFNKDMQVWENTGKSPDTAAMKYYGITPGTPWNEETKNSASGLLQDTQDQLNLIGAQDELQFQSRATSFMKSYSVSRDIAEAALLIIDQSNDYNSANSMVNSQKSALKAEGINTTTLSSTLQKYFNTQTTYHKNSTTSTSSTGKRPINNTLGAAKYLDRQYANTPEGKQVYNSFLGGTFVKENGSWYQVS